MSGHSIVKDQEDYFLVEKWFLDFIADNGEAMIFYSAILKWRKWKIPYTSWLHFSPEGDTILKSRFKDTQLPVKNNYHISWADHRFGVEGHWKPVSTPLSTRLFESENGCLDWQCYQPASEVRLKLGSKELLGKGYAEKLTLTIPPWKIQMNELRWGHYGSGRDTMVWVEILPNNDRKWLWVDGKRMEDFMISDDGITVPGLNLILELDKKAVLESDKKVFSVVKKIIRYLPGFNKIIPLPFLMAEACKWISNGTLKKNGEIVSSGASIHEYVNFSPGNA